MSVDKPRQHKFNAFSLRKGSFPHQLLIITVTEEVLSPAMQQVSAAKSQTTARKQPKLNAFKKGSTASLGLLIFKANALLCFHTYRHAIGVSL